MLLDIQSLGLRTLVRLENTIKHEAGSDINHLRVIHDRIVDDPDACIRILAQTDFKKCFITKVEFQSTEPNIDPVVMFWLTHVLPGMEHIQELTLKLPQAYETSVLFQLASFASSHRPNLRTLTWTGNVSARQWIPSTVEDLTLRRYTASSHQTIPCTIKHLTLIKPVNFAPLADLAKGLLPRLESLTIKSRNFISPCTLSDIFQVAPKKLVLRVRPRGGWACQCAKLASTAPKELLSAVEDLTLEYMPAVDGILGRTHTHSMLFENELQILHALCPLKTLTVKNVVVDAELVRRYNIKGARVTHKLSCW